MISESLSLFRGNVLTIDEKFQDLEIRSFNFNKSEYPDLVSYF